MLVSYLLLSSDKQTSLLDDNLLAIKADSDVISRRLQIMEMAACRLACTLYVQAIAWSRDGPKSWYFPEIRLLIV